MARPLGQTIEALANIAHLGGERLQRASSLWAAAINSTKALPTTTPSAVAATALADAASLIPKPTKTGVWVVLRMPANLLATSDTSKLPAPVTP